MLTRDVRQKVDAETGGRTLLNGVGLPAGEVEQWLGLAGPPMPTSPPLPRSVLPDHTAAVLRQLGAGEALLDRLPERRRRNPREEQAVAFVRRQLRRTREEFLRHHVLPVYAELTEGFTRPQRVAQLLEAASHRFPGLLPDRAKVAADAARPLGAKEGYELDQAIFVHHLMTAPAAGNDIIAAMRAPHPEALHLRRAFRDTGRVLLPHAEVVREDGHGYVLLRNPKYLNAEDEATNLSLEIAVDLILLDERTDVGVLRGARIERPRYPVTRGFNSGLNLTHLYEGKIPYLFFIERELGYVSKIQRGLAPPAEPVDPADRPRDAGEKLWIAAVDRFAIGGGLQLLLVVDHVVAAEGAIISLPAAAEGLIPGAAIMRLWRFLGERAARRLVFLNQPMKAGTAESRLFCDRVVPAQDVSQTVRDIVPELLRAGRMSALANRRALGFSVEPPETFRQYMAIYAREQAYCLLSEELKDNLERTWPAAKAAGECETKLSPSARSEERNQRD